MSEREQRPQEDRIQPKTRNDNYGFWLASSFDLVYQARREAGFFYALMLPAAVRMATGAAVRPIVIQRLDGGAFVVTP